MKKQNNDFAISSVFIFDERSVNRSDAIAWIDKKKKKTGERVERESLMVVG